MRAPIAILLFLSLAACDDANDDRREDAAEARSEAAEARTEAAEELQEGDTAEAMEELREAERLEGDTVR